MDIENVTSSLRAYKGRISRRSAVWGIAVAVALTGYWSLRHHLGTNEVGAKFNKITHACDNFGPGGTYFFLPVINDWYVLDAKLISTTMGRGKEGDRKYDDRLTFKTKDGNDIMMDLKVPYRVDPKCACEIIRRVATSNEELLEKIVRPYSRSVPRDSFGSLSSLEFASTPGRNAKAQEANDTLAEVLGKYGISVSNVNTGTFEFQNEVYREQVQQMKLAETAIPATMASIPAQKEENSRLLNEAETYKQDLIAAADGELAQAKTNADGYYNQKKNEAEGILTAGRNRAAAIAKERQAMISQGGKTMIQMQIAKCLEGKQIVQVPICDKNGTMFNTFDLNQFMSQFGAVKALQSKDKQ